MAEFGMPFDFDDSAPDPEEYEYSAVEQRMFNLAHRTNGVYPQVRIIKDNILDPKTYVGQSLLVYPAEGMLGVVVSKGLASIEGCDYINTEPKLITFDQESVKQVYDIVIHLDFIRQKVNAIKSRRSNGAALTDSLQRAPEVYEICIATVNIPVGATTLDESHITDQRLNTEICPSDGKPVCGMVGAAAQADTRMISEQLNAFFDRYTKQASERYAAFVDFLNKYRSDSTAAFDALMMWMENLKITSQADFDLWYTNFKSSNSSMFYSWYNAFKSNSSTDFNTWFQNLQNQLDSNQAANLQNQIDQHKSSLAASAGGVHGIRYLNGKLQYRLPNGWATFAELAVGLRSTHIDALGLTSFEIDALQYTSTQINELIEMEA